MLNYTRDLAMDPPHSQSALFMTPNSNAVVGPEACAKSFDFRMGNRGFIEVNVFTNNTQNTDQITVLARRWPGINVGSVVFSAKDPDFGKGWKTLRINLGGLFSGITYEGHVSIAALSIKLIIPKSFRCNSEPTEISKQFSCFS